MVWDGTVGQGIMVKNEFVCEILKLRIDNIAEIAQKPKRHVDNDPL
jgi:hypothetical protein